MSLRQSLIMSNGNYLIFAQRPVALILLGISAGLLALSAASFLGRRKDWRSSIAAAETGETN
jgi:TctA family transporter